MKANLNITIFRAVNEKSTVSIVFNLILFKLHTKRYIVILKIIKKIKLKQAKK